MRLLVTRPEPEAEETAARLRSLGHEVLVQPLLDIAFVEPPADAPKPTAIVVTSRNGVRALGQWPAAADWLDRPVFTTGAATAEAARAAGFADVRSGGGDVAALTKRILAELPVNRGQILYVAARDRAGRLAEDLGARGYHVRTVEAYRAMRVAHLDAATDAALRAGIIDGALFFSRRTAETFADLVNAAGLAAPAKRIVFYALSEAVAEPLRSFSGADIRLAPKPDADSLFVLIGSDG